MASECKFMDPIEEPDFNVVFNNKTDKTLLWIVNPWHLDTVQNETVFWPYNRFKGEDVTKKLIPSNSSIEKEVYWQLDYFDHGVSVFIYIFDKATVDTVPWDTIAKYRMVLHTYEITRAYLEAHDYTIVYPPDTTDR